MNRRIGASFNGRFPPLSPPPLHPRKKAGTHLGHPPSLLPSSLQVVVVSLCHHRHKTSKVWLPWFCGLGDFALWMPQQRWHSVSAQSRVKCWISWKACEPKPEKGSHNFCFGPLLRTVAALADFAAAGFSRSTTDGKIRPSIKKDFAKIAPINQ